MGLKTDIAGFLALNKRIEESKASIKSWESRDFDLKGKDITIEEAESVLEAKTRLAKGRQELENLKQRLDKLEQSIIGSLEVLQSNSINVAIDHFGEYSVKLSYSHGTDENDDPVTQTTLLFVKS